MSHVNLVGQLDNQLRYIETSAREYDACQIIEAIRIATSLRVIFHQTKNSTSILTHLQANIVKISSSIPDLPHPSGTWTPLVNVQQRILYADGKVTGYDPPEYKPKLDSVKLTRQISAPDWWDGEPIFLLNDKKVTRRDNVLWAANKDGGAHVDEILPTDYLALKNRFDDLMGMKVEFPKGVVTNFSCEKAHLASLRQMAYEVLNSPELLKLAGR